VAHVLLEIDTEQYIVMGHESLRIERLICALSAVDLLLEYGGSIFGWSGRVSGSSVSSFKTGRSLPRLLYYPPVPISKQFIVFGLEITFL
jgi:hypothetical protein